MKRPVAMIVPIVLLLGGQASAQDLLRKSERVANEGTIGNAWMLADGVALATAGYPPQFADEREDVCIGLGYRINPDGATSDFVVLRQWRSGGDDGEPEDFWPAFAQSSADAVAQWRFKPRPEIKNPQSVYTVATLTFSGGQNRGTELAGHCRIGDLASVIQERKSKRVQRSSTTADIERANRAGRAQGAMNPNPGLR